MQSTLTFKTQLNVDFHSVKMILESLASKVPMQKEKNWLGFLFELWL